MPLMAGFNSVRDRDRFRAIRDDERYWNEELDS